MDIFGIRIYKEYFQFAAAHFLIFEDGTREELHGHNYHVEMSLQGELGEGRDIFIDFSHIKPIVRAACDSIDHLTLLPAYSRFLTVKDDGGSVEALYQDGSRWVFPARDCKILPLPNTSAERLAQYLCAKTLETLQARYPEAAIRELTFSVEESRGQAAVYGQRFDTPQALKSLPLPYYQPE